MKRIGGVMSGFVEEKRMLEYENISESERIQRRKAIDRKYDCAKFEFERYESILDE